LPSKKEEAAQGQAKPPKPLQGSMDLVAMSNSVRRQNARSKVRAPTKKVTSHAALFGPKKAPAPPAGGGGGGGGGGGENARPSPFGTGGGGKKHHHQPSSFPSSSLGSRNAKASSSTSSTGAKEESRHILPDGPSSSAQTETDTKKTTTCLEPKNSHGIHGYSNVSTPLYPLTAPTPNP
jgi:hypothetical protein